ncbi:3-ketoacyl-CoA reductase [Artomyces pyxidatus]|uniref:3-ketoacyl-CoA reductase n=1 Tax=Artomyces pyxidatus TaxID=48021 RepID=A0ACB8T7V5_9AGAM|nr:3-ketoacyl-CoA reductase [Artomyces pyxidatus]
MSSQATTSIAAMASSFLASVKILTNTQPCAAAGLLALGSFTVASTLVAWTSVFLRIFVRPGINLKKFGAKKGAWAVVTGASDGIGREFSLQLAKAGFNVLLAARNGEKLAAVAQEIDGKSGSAVQTKTFAIDFAHADDATYEQFQSTLKDLDIGILVNNVGKSHEMPTDFIDTPAEEMNDILAINVNATLRVTSFVAPGMASRHRGLILNIGSFAGSAPSPMLATYSASKAFLVTFSEALAAELKPKGVVVELANTYFVVSSMSKIRRASAMVPTPAAYVRSVLRKIAPGTQTPFWSHALLDYVMQIAPASIVQAYTHALHVDIRKRALRKKEREAKKN